MNSGMTAVVGLIIIAVILHIATHFMPDAIEIGDVMYTHDDVTHVLINPPMPLPPIEESVERLAKYIAHNCLSPADSRTMERCVLYTLGQDVTYP